MFVRMQNFKITAIGDDNPHKSELIGFCHHGKTPESDQAYFTGVNVETFSFDYEPEPIRLLLWDIDRTSDGGLFFPSFTASQGGLIFLTRNETRGWLNTGNALYAQYLNTTQQAYTNSKKCFDLRNHPISFVFTGWDNDASKPFDKKLFSEKAKEFLKGINKIRKEASIAPLSNLTFYLTSTKNNRAYRVTVTPKSVEFSEEIKLYEGKTKKSPFIKDYFENVVAKSYAVATNPAHEEELDDDDTTSHHKNDPHNSLTMPLAVSISELFNGSMRMFSGIFQSYATPRDNTSSIKPPSATAMSNGRNKGR